MPRRIEPLTVIANPWHALDDEGRPAASVQILGTDAIIGGSTNIARSEAAGVQVYDFREEPVTLRPASPRELAHYLRQIKDGALLPADAPTATRAGLGYREPLAALHEARTRALAAFEEQAGYPPEEPAESEGPDTAAYGSAPSETFVERGAPSPGFVPPFPSDDSRSEK